MSRGRIAALAALAAALAALACGSSGQQLRVSAAASLHAAFTRYASELRGVRVRFSFAGSDVLAAQIERGARPDVFASANTALPARLFARGLVERPVEFAANRLVIAVPAASGIAGLPALEHAGVSIAVGAAAVPVGAYTSAVLARIAPPQRRLLLANIRDREPDVTGIVGKLMQGAVDAGFVYQTDVLASGSRLRAIALPPGLQPRVGYAAAVVRGCAHLPAARAFVVGLRGGPARAALSRAGFLAPAGT